MELKLILRLLIPIFAVLLDLIFGDPVWLYHPVRAVGSCITFFEKLIRKAFPKTPKGEVIGGFVLAVIIPILFFGGSLLILFWVTSVNLYLGFFVEIFLAYQLLAAKSLKQESAKVGAFLKSGDIAGARKALSYIVGRDTMNLEEEKIVVATVETIAENTSDGVIAPLFYLVIGGVPLCFLYKAINTLDSMVGYRNKKYEYFGKASAILDDIANYIPARISGIIMLLATTLCGYNFRNALKVYFRDRKNHASPNSGQTEAVCAGALEMQLGGGGSYGGVWKEKPTLGDSIKAPTQKRIDMANKLMIATTILSMLIFVAIKVIIFLGIWR